MKIIEQIKTYIAGLPESKSCEMETLHTKMLLLMPACKLWFLDGKDQKGKTVSNPNIGYGNYHIKYADGSEKEFYKIGLSANTTGISVYLMGIKDKTYLTKMYGNSIGKATITGYCIKFKTLKDIDLKVLEAAVTNIYLAQT